MARLFDEKAFLESLLGPQQTPRFNSYASFPYQESVGKAVSNDFNRKLSAGNVNQVDKQKEEAWNMEQYKKLFGDTMKTQGVDYQKLANDYAKDLNAINMSDTMNPYSTSYKMLQNEKATQNVLDESLARQIREKAERLAAEQAEKDRVAALTYNGRRDNTGSYRHPKGSAVDPEAKNADSAENIRIAQYIRSMIPGGAVNLDNRTLIAQNQDLVGKAIKMIAEADAAKSASWTQEADDHEYIMSRIRNNPSLQGMTEEEMAKSTPYGVVWQELQNYRKKMQPSAYNPNTDNPIKIR